MLKGYYGFLANNVKKTSAFYTSFNITDSCIVVTGMSSYKNTTLDFLPFTPKINFNINIKKKTSEAQTVQWDRKPTNS